MPPVLGEGHSDPGSSNAGKEKTLPGRWLGGRPVLRGSLSPITEGAIEVSAEESGVVRPVVEDRSGATSPKVMLATPFAEPWPWTPFVPLTPLTAG